MQSRNSIVPIGDESEWPFVGAHSSSCHLEQDPSQVDQPCLVPDWISQ